MQSIFLCEAREVLIMTEHTKIAFLVEFTTLKTPPSESDITGRILSAVESVDHPEGITGLTVTETRREALKSEPRTCLGCADTIDQTRPEKLCDACEEMFLDTYMD